MPVYDLLAILVTGLLAGLACKLLRLPLMLGYLLAGVLLGEAVTGWVAGHAKVIEQLAEAGVFLLLFTVGLEFSLHNLGRLARYFALGGSVQMLLVAVPTAVVLASLGSSWQAALLLSAAVSFSSTVVVFRALAEFGHTGTPAGQRAVSILLFQDAALVPMLLAVPLLTGTGGDSGPLAFWLLGLWSLLFLAGVVIAREVLVFWIAPTLARLRSPELVLLFALVVLGLVTLASQAVGLPAALGAFAAGLIFNGNRLSAQVDALILPFREVFSATFFVSLGLLMNPLSLTWGLPMALAVLLAIVAWKAVSAIVALRLTGLTWRASTGMGVGLAHIGEFGFVLALAGLNAGVVSSDAYQLLLGAALGSLLLTPILLKFGLRWTEPAASEEAPHRARGWTPHTAVVIGAGPIGRQVTSQLETSGCDVCLIDMSPINLHPFAAQAFHTVAGDAREASILRLAGVPAAELAAIAVPDDQVALAIVRTARSLSGRTTLVVRCRYQSNESALTRAGADHVISEESVAASAILNILAQLDQPAGTTKTDSPKKED